VCLHKLFFTLTLLLSPPPSTHSLFPPPRGMSVPRQPTMLLRLVASQVIVSRVCLFANVAHVVPPLLVDGTSVSLHFVLVSELLPTIWARDRRLFLALLTSAFCSAGLHQQGTTGWWGVAYGIDSWI
jgi:hypothetical protein